MIRTAIPARPQSFVPAFDAREKDDVKATQSVTVAGPQQSCIDLPVMR